MHPPHDERLLLLLEVFRDYIVTVNPVQAAQGILEYSFFIAKGDTDFHF